MNKLNEIFSLIIIVIFWNIAYFLLGFEKTIVAAIAMGFFYYLNN